MLMCVYVHKRERGRGVMGVGGWVRNQERDRLGGRAGQASRQVDYEESQPNSNPFFQHSPEAPSTLTHFLWTRLFLFLHLSPWYPCRMEIVPGTAAPMGRHSYARLYVSQTRKLWREIAQPARTQIPWIHTHTYIYIYSERERERALCTCVYNKWLLYCKASCLYNSQCTTALNIHADKLSNRTESLTVLYASFAKCLSPSLKATIFLVFLADSLQNKQYSVLMYLYRPPDLYAI